MIWLYLDYFFLLFHAALILFVLGGWVPRRTRRLHLLVTASILVSWFGLGLWYGIGYCPCTDWHWEIKRKLGETGLPFSYVKYYLDTLTRNRWSAAFVDQMVVFCGLAAFSLSLWLNWRDRRSA